MPFPLSTYYADTIGNFSGVCLSPLLHLHRPVFRDNASGNSAFRYLWACITLFPGIGSVSLIFYPFLFSPSSPCWWRLRSWWWSASSSYPTLSAVSGSPSPSCPSRWAAWWWWWYICWWWWRWLFWSPLVSNLSTTRYPIAWVAHWKSAWGHLIIHTRKSARKKVTTNLFSSNAPQHLLRNKDPPIIFAPFWSTTVRTKQGRCTLWLIPVVCHYDSRDQDDSYPSETFTKDQDDSYPFDTFTRHITGCLHP